MAEDKGKEVKKEGAGPSSGPGGKKDYSTAILERKKSPNRLVVDDAVRAAPPRPPPRVPAGPEGPGSPSPRGPATLGGLPGPARRGQGGPGPPSRGPAAVWCPPRPPPGPGPAPGGRTDRGSPVGLTRGNPRAGPRPPGAGR